MSLLRGPLILARQTGAASFQQARHASYWTRPDPHGGSSIWRPVSFICGPLLIGFCVVTFARMEHAHRDVLDYKYMRIRNKEFPWGPDGLFEKSEHH